MLFYRSQSIFAFNFNKDEGAFAYAANTMEWNGGGGDSIAHIPHGENENDLKISFPFKVARAERI